MRRYAGMNRARDLFGPITALATIRPPGPSFADWRRFLEECREAGIAAVEGSQFSTPLGYALLKRWRWLEDSERMGVPYEQAEAAFCAAIDREREAYGRADRERAETAARTLAERDGKNRRRNGRAPIDDAAADDIFTYAEERLG